MPLFILGIGKFLLKFDRLSLPKEQNVTQTYPIYGVVGLF